MLENAGYVPFVPGMGCNAESKACRAMLGPSSGKTRKKGLALPSAAAPTLSLGNHSRSSVADT